MSQISKTVSLQSDRIGNKALLILGPLVQRLSKQPAFQMEERRFVCTTDERGNSVSAIDLNTGEIKAMPGGELAT